MEKKKGFIGWLITNEHNQPLFSEEDKKIWLFYKKEEAEALLEEQAMIVPKHNKTRKIVEVQVIFFKR